MIRTILLTSILLAAAAAGVADAATVKVSLAGMTEATAKIELLKASQAACSDVSAIDYAPCVHETYRDALAQAAKIRATRMASLAY